MNNKDNRNILYDKESLNLNFHLLKSDDGKFHFMASSGEKIYGQSTLCPTNENSDLVRIESIYVDPQVRGAGIGRQLLLFIENTLKKSGFSGIFAQTTGDISFLYRINSFFREAGYICSGYQSHISKYSVDEIVNSRFKEVVDILGTDKSIKSLADISPNMIKSAREKEHIFINNTGQYSKTLSKAVINNEHMTAIVLCDASDDILCIKDIFVFPQNKDKGILMRILGVLVKEAKKNNLAHLLIRTGNTHIEEGLLKCMVSPKSKQYEQEFVKVL